MKAYIRSGIAISPQDTYQEGLFQESPLQPAQSRMKCMEPDYKEIINPAISRRMSRIVKMGIAAALKSLKEAGVEKPDAIITGTGLGCMEDTGTFLSSMVKNKEQFLTPTAFIQSTHNTIAGQIALMLKCNNYNFAYVHRGFSFENALLDATMMLQNGEAKNVLLGGIDEITNDYFNITSRMGLWKTNVPPDSDAFRVKSRGTLAGEGSVFFTLQSNSDGASAMFNGLEMLYKPGSSQEIAEAINRMLEAAGITINDIDAVMTGNNGWPKYDKLYRPLTETLFNGKPLLGFKHLCGEYMTASSFAAWLSSAILKNRKVPEGVQLEGPPMKDYKHILIYNHYMGVDHTLMLVSAC